MSMKKIIKNYENKLEMHEERMIKLTTLKKEICIMDEIIKLCNYYYDKCPTIIDDEIVYTDYIDYNFQYLNNYSLTSNYLLSNEGFLNIHLCYDLTNKDLLNSETKNYLHVLRDYLNTINKVLKKYHIFIMYEEFRNEKEVSKIFITINSNKKIKKKQITDKDLRRKLKYS